MKIRTLGYQLSLFAFVTLYAVLGLHLTAAAQQICNGGVCVTTWQQDTGVPDLSAGGVYRTGENLMESTIVATTFNNNGFGQICSTDTVPGGPLDGQVYAQPLVLTNTSISPNPVVYVVTQNDTLYAIDGTNCTFLNHVHLIPSSQTAVPCGNFEGGPCGTIKPKVGVLGTPVIEVTAGRGTIYVVTQSVDNQPTPNYYHYLHALDAQTLGERSDSPVLICPTNPCTNASNFSHTHIQRPALLLANGYVYVAFSMMDGTTATKPPNGAIFGYQASDFSIAPLYFETSLGQQTLSNGGGIWMGGAGPAFGPDGSGSNWIYVTTANGTFDQATNWGDSFLKLNPSNLTIATNTNNQPVGYLTPNDENWRQDGNCGNGAGDVDFGSGGVTLIPDNELTYQSQNYGYMAVSGEKEGYLWFIRRDVPGQFGGNLNSCTPGQGGANVQTYAVDPTLPITPVIHNNIAFWDSESASFPTKPFVYVAPQNEKPNTTPNQNYLYQFALCTAGTDKNPICGSTYSVRAPLACCTYGITPTISAASPQAGDAILWALEKTDGGCSIADGTCGSPGKLLPVNGILYAFDALTLAPLYNSGTCQTRDKINQATKFSVPTVANGYVYVGTQSPYVVNQGNAGNGTLYIFGPTSKICQ